MTDVAVQPTAQPSSRALRRIRIVKEGLNELEQLGSPDAIADFLVTDWSANRDERVPSGEVPPSEDKGVTAFVRKFDEGAYPFLDENFTTLPDAALVSVR